MTKESSSRIVKSIHWPRIVLLVAGLQCLVWGVLIVCWPERSSVAYGLAEPPREIFLWQGTGLIILLYGIGYLIASSDPRRHWAVVLLGLLAKILGPIGMAFSVWQGRVPARVFVMIPINDMIWWLPFAVIVVRGSILRNHSD